MRPWSPSRSLTLERAVSDTIELSDILRARFDERKIYLMGESWGSILGVLAVQRRPDLYYAWIGSGQMVDVVETDRRVYHDLVAYAARTGDGALAAKLARSASRRTATSLGRTPTCSPGTSTSTRRTRPRRATWRVVRRPGSTRSGCWVLNTTSSRR